MKKTINYYGSFILMLVIVAVIFIIGIKGTEINQDIFIPFLEKLTELAIKFRCLVDNN